MFRRAISGIILSLLIGGFMSSLLKTPIVQAVTVTVPDDYSSIQEAVNHASEGDTISVRSGTYDEVILGKALTIIGEGRDSTIVELLEVSGSIDLYLTNVDVNNLIADNSTTVWATGCHFSEVYVNSEAKLLLSQSDAWKLHVYDRGQVLGFYDLPFFGRMVFSLPFGFMLYLLPILLVAAVVMVVVFLYIHQKKRQTAPSVEGKRQLVKASE